MTSNIGVRQLKDFGQGVGFATQARQEAAEDNSKTVIQNALKRTFSPEFLNRIDDVVIFNSLDQDDIFKIIIEYPFLQTKCRFLFSNIVEPGFELEVG